MLINIYHRDSEKQYELPSKFEVCPRCDGHGKHVNPNIDGHGITSDEWANEWDEEEKQTYLSGGYDVECYECKGKRVVSVVDEALLTKRQQVIFHHYLKQETDRRDLDRMSEMERLMGA